jgi:hypothetical protein
LSLSGSAYGYADSDPIGRKDPSGLCNAGAPYCGGADFSWGTDSQGRPVYVGEPSAGAGVEDLPAAEVHGGVSDTWSASFSIPKVWDWLTGLFD